MATLWEPSTETDIPLKTDKEVELIAA